MALPNVTTGAQASSSNHINEYRTHLTGAFGKTEAWHFRLSTGNDLLVTLADAAGARKFSIRDSAEAEIFKVDSDGNITVTGTLTQSGAFILPVSASPAQTADGSIVWDSDDDRITVGDGTSRKTFYPGDFGFEEVGRNTVEQTTTSTSTVDIVTVTFTRSVAATEGLLIVGNASKDALAAQAVQLGLKLNTTVQYDPAVQSLASSSGTNQAEDGMFMLWIMPRSTGYLNGVLGWEQWQISATGAQAKAQTAVVAPSNNLITAALTQLVITGRNVTSNNNLAVKDVVVYAF